MTPPHGNMSVVTGLRIYTANNNPNADPVKYRIRGRTMGGALVKGRVDNRCWNVNSNNRISSENCDASSARQRFYMNDLGEIRVKSHPALCLDPRNEVDTANQGMPFVLCLSVSLGADHKDAKFHRFTANPRTERFESVKYRGKCIAYDDTSNQLAMSPCENEDDRQQFYFRGGHIDAMVDDNWLLISKGSLPWISEFDRNPTGVEIVSTYESGDSEKYFMEVTLHDSTRPFYEYEVSQ